MGVVGEHKVETAQRHGGLGNGAREVETHSQKTSDMLVVQRDLHYLTSAFKGQECNWERWAREGSCRGTNSQGSVGSREVCGNLVRHYPDLTQCVFLQRWFWLVRVLLSLFIGAEIVGECVMQWMGEEGGGHRTLGQMENLGWVPTPSSHSPSSAHASTLTVYMDWALDAPPPTLCTVSHLPSPLSQFHVLNLLPDLSPPLPSESPHSGALQRRMVSRQR